MATMITVPTTRTVATVDLEDTGLVSLHVGGTSGARVHLTAAQAREIGAALADYARAADEYASEQVGVGA
jgi:hypothetical protein